MIKSVEYLRDNGKITAYVVVEETTVATAVLNGKTYPETGNVSEPFDYNLHNFTFDESELTGAGKFEVCLTTKKYWPNKPVKQMEKSSFTIRFNPSAIIPEKEALFRSSRNLRLCNVEDKGNYQGLCWTQELFLTEDNRPVRVYTAIADLNKTEILAGTPDAQPYFIAGKTQTVMEEALAVEKQKRNVLCATNADFFDVFGDCHPTGLCISQNRIVSNPDANNAIFAIRTDGTPVIGFSKNFDLKNIKEAVSGKEIIVKDGAVGDTDILQPFGETPYPRTAFGITADNKVIQMVVDGNKEQWSNGASLIELAMLMIEKGAVTALNADGGGSSTFIVRTNDSLSMMNKPTGRVLIDKTGRSLFNSMLVVAKDYYEN